MYPVPPAKEVSHFIFYDTKNIHTKRAGNERRRGIKELTFQIHLKRLSHLEHALDMRHAQRLVLVHRERLRRPREIFDLPTIDVALGEVVVVLVAQLFDLHALDMLDFLDKHLPHRLLGFEAQLAVA